MTTLTGRRVSVLVDGERITGWIVNADASDWVKVLCDDGTYRLVNIEDFELDRESEIEVTP